MSSPAKTYQNEMHGNLGFFATWLPSDSLDIGDVGVLEGGRFRKLSSLTDLEIKFSVSPKGPPQDLRYTSTSGTTLTVGGAAPVANIPGVSAEIKIAFSHEGSFLFHASNVRNAKLENVAALCESILNAYARGQWKKEWYLIDSLHTAECATIVVTEGSSSGLVLAASADVSLGTMPLADPRVQLSVSSSSGKMLQIVASRNLRPLYSCLRLKHSWFSDPSVAPVRGKARATSELPVAKPPIAELLGS